MPPKHLKEFDVAVAVWNEFHAPELCAGLARSGLRTIALRNHLRSIPGVTTKASYLSHIIQRCVARGGPLRGQLLEATQDIFEEHASRNAHRARIFWGWNGHSLSGFKNARQAGAIVICERGSTHAKWAARRLNEIHGSLGWGQTNHDESSRNRKALEEYCEAEWISIPSRFVEKTFIEEGVPQSKLFVNPYGIDRSRWENVHGSDRNAGRLVFVFTAAITPRKGVHVLLRAWEKAGLKDAELWFCGGVHFPIRDLGLPVGESVKFLGHQDHAGIARIYNRASVYLLPSFEEGMARSGLEAFAAGLPLVITEETGLTDVMEPGRHGWVVPSGNVDALADVLRTAAADRDRILKMSADCQATGLQYTKEAYGERAAAFASRVLESGGLS